MGQIESVSCHCHQMKKPILPLTPEDGGEMGVLMLLL